MHVQPLLLCVRLLLRSRTHLARLPPAHTVLDAVELDCFGEPGHRQRDGRNVTLLVCEAVFIKPVVEISLEQALATFKVV